MRFILVDEIVELDPGKHIIALKRMPADEELFKDHFPGFPVVPGVLLTEMIGQAGGKCLEAEKPERGKPMLLRIKSASFHRWVLPNESAKIHVTVKKSQAQYATIEGYILVKDELACKSELFFSFLPYNKFEQDHGDSVLEEYQYKQRGK